MGLVLEGIGDWSGAIAAFDGYLLRITLFTPWRRRSRRCCRLLPPSCSPARPVAPSRLFRSCVDPTAVRAAAGIAGDRCRTRPARTVRPRRLSGRATWLVLPAATGPASTVSPASSVAHVFFNLPLATRLFLEALNTVSSDQWRLASQLGMRAVPSFRFIEWPMLRAALPGRRRAGVHAVHHLPSRWC